METGTKIARLLLADDHSGMLAQTARLLETEFDVVGTAGTGPKVIRSTTVRRSSRPPSRIPSCALAIA
jgi:hypothetical protein